MKMDQQNLKQSIDVLKRRLRDADSDRILGYTTGFKHIDNMVGRMEAGQVWVIGGYNGTGKSYFILNMIEGILKEWNKVTKKGYKPPQMCIFSTELSTEDYIFRHVLMRMGIYELTLMNNIKQFKSQVVEVLDKYLEERLLNPESLRIYGGMTSYEEIEKTIKTLKYKPNVIFVDYVGQLSYQKIYTEKDIMEILPLKFKKMALDNELTVVLVSQMNIYTMTKDWKSSESQLPGYSYGKKLNDVAHTGFVLTRKKESGQLSNNLELHVTKARNGVMGILPFKILSGYKLEKDTSTD